ncbi:MAG: hypothetical protein ABSH56_29770 [Bryobacteraceae bacterium]
MRENWRRTLIVGLAFVLAMAGTFVFAYRAGRHARYLHAANEPIRAWMSVPFIAHTHHVPAAVLFQAIGVAPRQPHDRRSVRHLAHDLNRPVPEVIAQLQRALDAAAHPSGS